MNNELEKIENDYRKNSRQIEDFIDQIDYVNNWVYRITNRHNSNLLIEACDEAISEIKKVNNETTYIKEEQLKKYRNKRREYE
ncbi:MAG: hypothetical protein PHH04_08540 [Thomasclavelia sp.]|jgi:predicted  nucleic acid-binding Zn-ribbon protein|nr:hypothetical protein [Thomasclavelia sp.]